MEAGADTVEAQAKWLNLSQRPYRNREYHRQAGRTISLISYVSSGMNKNPIGFVIPKWFEIIGNALLKGNASDVYC